MKRVDIIKYIAILLVTAAAICYAAPEESTTVTAKEIEDAVEQVTKKNPFELMQAMSKQRNQSASVDNFNAIPSPVVEVAPELFVGTVMLKFLRAKNIMPVIEKLVAPYGTVSVDEETNTLIVTGSREQVDKVLKEVRKADQTPMQIMIDVVMLDVVLDDATETGVDWFNTTLGSNMSYLQEVIPSTVTSGAALSILKGDFDVIIRALQEKKDVEILSNPQLMVLSGQTAVLKTVEEIPYEEVSSTSEGGTLTSTEFKDAGVTLEVSPVITDEGKIIIKVKPSQSVKTGESSANGVPIVDKREVDTTLIMEDGQIAVIGGLRKKQATIISHKVPLLGDLPLIGFLFRDDKTQIINSELIIMLKPRIHKGNETLTDHEKQKFEEMKNRPPLKVIVKEPTLIRNVHEIQKAITK